MWRGILQQNTTLIQPQNQITLMVIIKQLLLDSYLVQVHTFVYVLRFFKV